MKKEIVKAFVIILALPLLGLAQVIAAIRLIFALTISFTWNQSSESFEKWLGKVDGSIKKLKSDE